MPTLCKQSLLMHFLIAWPVKHVRHRNVVSALEEASANPQCLQNCSLGLSSQKKPRVRCVGQQMGH